MSISWDDHKELKIIKDSLMSRYDLLEYLGGGGFGKVFKFYDKSLERECALKVLNIDKLNESREKERKEKKDRFIKEAKAYAKCKHPNIVPIFDIGGEETFPYFTMEYVEGESLKNVIAEKCRLSLTDVLKISEGILSALECIHRHGLVHRDIKPGNIMIEKESGRSIIIDFGAAKDLNLSSTSGGIGFGTAFYMATEQFRDSSKITSQTDIYSLGVVLYEMLTGEVPFDGKEYGEVMYGHLHKPVPNIREMNPKLPVGFKDIIFKAMAKKPKDRYANARDFRNALRKIDETQKWIAKGLAPKLQKLAEGKKGLKRKVKSLITISGIIVAAAAAFIFLKSSILKRQYDEFVSTAKTFIESKDWEKASESLKKAKELKNSEEIKRIFAEITRKRTEGMKKDWGDLKAVLMGESGIKDKLEKCREFLAKHQGIPGNGEYTAIVSEVNNSISKLETAVKLDKEYQNLLSTTGEYIKKEDFPKAVETLEKAKKNRGGDTAEIAALSKEIEEKQIGAIRNDFESLKRFLAGGAAKEEKLEDCRKFLDKHQGIPGNDEKTAIISKVTLSISTLDAAVKLEEYRNLLDAAGKYLKKGDYSKAVEALEKARENRGGDTAEISALSKKISKAQIAEMKAGFDSLKKFLAGGATNKEKIEKCQAFLAKHQNTPGDKKTMVDETDRFISELDAKIEPGDQYQKYIDTVNNLIKSEDYEKAEKELINARKIKDTVEVKRLSATITRELEKDRYHGRKEYKALKVKLTLSQFQAFEKHYPESIHLQDLKDRLKNVEKNLPAEKYWEMPIRKNEKGYYEVTFGSEHNGHLMIYIPEKGIWIDKYEVSWGKYIRFFKGALSSIENEYPAAVTYEEAVQYCNNYGLRLPKVDEWEYVAGKGKFTYPWGNESPLVPDIKGEWRANFNTLNGNSDKDGYTRRAPVKSFEKFSSPFGAVNMAGNEWEWVQGKVLKGGDFLSLEDDLKIANSRKGKELDRKGFRCIREEKKSRLIE